MAERLSTSGPLPTAALKNLSYLNEKERELERLEVENKKLRDKIHELQYALEQIRSLVIETID